MEVAKEDMEVQEETVPSCAQMVHIPKPMD